MPAIHDTAPTEEEMDALFFAELDRDALDEHDSRAEGTCLACANGVHEAIEGASGCICPCHAPATPRKQTNLREFYVDPYAFGLKLAGAR